MRLASRAVRREYDHQSSTSFYLAVLFKQMRHQNTGRVWQTPVQELLGRPLQTDEAPKQGACLADPRAGVVHQQYHVEVAETTWLRVRVVRLSGCLRSPAFTGLVERNRVWECSVSSSLQGFPSQRDLGNSAHGP